MALQDKGSDMSMVDVRLATYLVQTLIIVCRWVRSESRVCFCFGILFAPNSLDSSKTTGLPQNENFSAKCSASLAFSVLFVFKR